jgi:arginyl-tRNA synthetase
MIEKLAELAARAANELYQEKTSPVFTRTEEQHGDFATNIALQLSSKVGIPPLTVAEQIKDKLKSYDETLLLSVAGPGFINVALADSTIFLAATEATKLHRPLEGKVIVAEYSDPNPFKVLHAGHLYTTLVGDAVANILEVGGGVVHRVNFGGDVGLHVARAMWSILGKLGGELPQKLDDILAVERAAWISQCYVEGTTAYETDKAAAQEIMNINKRIYALHEEKDHQSAFAQIYWTCRKWSYEGFDQLYKELAVKPFEKYYPESEVAESGLATVKAHVGDVYETSDGAIIFRGEKHGLFTQVFVSSEGLPTYAGKDVGLIQEKNKDYHYDISFIITDVAQKDHLAVVLKSVEQFEPELVHKTIHHTHGRINFSDGRKMSSREGNIITSEDVLLAAKKAAGTDDQKVILGAVRYSFLKNRIGGDISYDPKESVSQEGNSGPYVQYALVRARSIIRKAASNTKRPSDFRLQGEALEPGERSLARQLNMYPEVFALALEDYSPHHICNYIFETCQVFNRFYENNRVIDHPRSETRLGLVFAYEAMLSHALDILGMPKPEKM